MNELKVMVMFCDEVLQNVDGAYQRLLRRILFADDTKINWDKVYDVMMNELPELTMRNDYSRENMM